MQKSVFYSWQSDLPNSVNRGLIQTALEGAAKAITHDDSIAIEPVIDRDTQGLPGAPDIAAAIFAKITAADVFVADISIIFKKGKRSVPNPNVLIELGYAFKALGHEKIVLVFNSAYGKIEDLPFDLRTKRVLTYTVREGDDKSTERTVLQSKLDRSIRDALQHGRHLEETGPSIPAILAIENNATNRIAVLRKDMARIYEQLKDLEPKKYSSGGTVTDLKEALVQTQPHVAEFLKIFEAIALADDVSTAIEVTRFFGLIYEKYDSPKGFSGPRSAADFDYFKFLGHELFTSFIAFLLKERRWTIIDSVLKEPIPTSYTPRTGGQGLLYWESASEHLPLLENASRQTRRISMHADILNERHTIGGLSTIMPSNDLMAADLFLFLRGEHEMNSKSVPFFKWRPWSILFIENTPLFILAAENKKSAEGLCIALDIPDIASLKTDISLYAPWITRFFTSMWRTPITQEAINKIGTR